MLHLIVEAPFRVFFKDLLMPPTPTKSSDKATLSQELNNNKDLTKDSKNK